MEIDLLEYDIKKKKIKSDKLDIAYPKGILNNYTTYYEKGIIVRDWGTGEEISKDLEREPIKYSEDSGDSITYIEKVKNNIQQRAKLLYDKYGWDKQDCIIIAKGNIFIGINK